MKFKSAILVTNKDPSYLGCAYIKNQRLNGQVFRTRDEVEVIRIYILINN